MSIAYTFGEYRIVPASRELRCGDRLIDLPPHVFDCIAYLAGNHERAVGRDELVAAVWGKAEVSDTLLGQTILRIRRELGDDARSQRVLRTIPRFGYRWVAPLAIGESTAAAADAPAILADSASAPGDAEAASPTPAPRRRAIRGATIGFGVAAVLAIAAAASWSWRGRHPATPTPAAPPALAAAVLPAAVEAGNESAWMRLGVMDIVAGQLRSAGLPSVPSEDVVALLKKPEDQRSGTLRDALAVDLLVTPHVQQVESEWRIDLDAEAGAGQRFNAGASARDVAAAARAAADKLLVALGRAPPAGSPEADPDAALVKRIDAAVLADDPDGARALVAAATPAQQRSPEVRLRLAKIDFRGGRLDAARERLDALLAEAPASTAPVLRGSVLNGLGAVAIRQGRLAEAGRIFGEAIGLLEPHNDPSQLGQAYLGRAATAAEERRFDAAAADYARARVALRQANDTLALIRVAANEGFVDQDQGRPAQALPQLVAATDGFKRWGALNEAVLTYIGQIGCYLALLDDHSAIQAADAAAELAPRIDNPATLAGLTLARARALIAVGRLREAREALDALRSTTRDPEAAAGAGYLLAELELDAGNAAAAKDLAAQAVDALAQGAPTARAQAWLVMTRAALAGSDRGRVEQASAGFAQWAANADDPRVQLLAGLARAEVARRFGESAEWHRAYDGARDLALRGAIPNEIAAVARSYFDALLADHDLAAAEVEAGRVSRWSDRDFACAVLEARLYAALGRNEARQTAVARARVLAGERAIPAEALAAPLSTRAAAR